jgi:hypothetical protein
VRTSSIVLSGNGKCEHLLPDVRAPSLLPLSVTLVLDYSLLHCIMLRKFLLYLVGFFKS